MRDKVHIEEVKVRLTEGDKACLEHLSRERGIPPAVLARTLIKQYLVTAMYQAVSIQTGNNMGSPAKGLGGASHGNQGSA